MNEGRREKERERMEEGRGAKEETDGETCRERMQFERKREAP